ncbi:uncharacterized protein LOC125855799 [Solanum stenotomum]|uniref:uncharacterized protein LOC125855799 n=1 Tax=Solanum stenotomum TaxID=172797 RepID=UPI0020D011EB|nr:uncharacterized protein LOC125855799 [Solanum stenotomum]
MRRRTRIQIIRSLHEVTKALFGKLWWNFRTTTSLWSSFMWTKYCKKHHPVLAKGTGASHAWRKMVEVREEVEREIWWQVMSGEASFWFDNWTKQGALYFLEETVRGEEEIEVKQFIVNGEWDRLKINMVLSAEMTKYIVENIRPKIEVGAVDKAWWMGNQSGEFTFADCASIEMEAGLQQTIKKWWAASSKPKVKAVFQAIPAILMWELWKRRNARKNGKERNWEDVLEVLQQYKPKLHYRAVSWTKPQKGWMKCNTNGASRGNPGECTYSFCIRDDFGDLVYAEAQRMGNGNSMEAETRAILRALQHCKITAQMWLWR